MAESEQAERLLGNNESREESELIVPSEESYFKPRLHENVCPYCGYMSRDKKSVDKHINNQHEMNIWFKCRYCKYTYVDGEAMKLHIKRHHDLHVDTNEIWDLIVIDPREIDRLKRAQAQKRRLGNKVGHSNFKPIDEKDFKPRVDPYSCQYCDYISRRRLDVDRHVNSVHEMTHWYQCTDCMYASLSRPELSTHMIKNHKKYLNAISLKSCLIKDKKVVEHLKFMRDKKSQMNKSNSKQQKFIPIDKDNFKPRVNPKNCPYCSYVSKIKFHTDVHVNRMHEMTTWFKCNLCDYASLSPRAFIHHMKNQHSINVRRGDSTFRESIVKNQQEIEDLKKRRIHSKIITGKLPMMQSEVQFKGEIEIEEHPVELDGDENVTRNEAFLEAGLSDLDEEWLAGPSW